MKIIIDFLKHNVLLIIILLVLLIAGISVIRKSNTKTVETAEVISETEEYPLWEKVDPETIETLDTLITPTPEATATAEISIIEPELISTVSAQATASAKVTTSSNPAKSSGYYYYVPAEYYWDIEFSQEQTIEIKN